MGDSKAFPKDEEGALPRLSQLIAEVQAVLPERVRLAVQHSNGLSPDLFLGVGDAFLPLYFDERQDVVQELNEIFARSWTFDDSTSNFVFDRKLFQKEMPVFREDCLYEISNNLVESPLIIFIESQYWYVHIYEQGYFFPLDQENAAEFIDYCVDQIYP